MKKVFNQLCEKSQLVLMALLLVCGTTVMTSCGSDDDDEGGSGNLNAPKYEDDSALYTLDRSGQSDTGIRSIELTASGNYLLITTSAKTRGESILKHHNFLKGGYGRITTRAYEDDGIIYGKFTKRGDNTFELEGFGTIVVNGGTNNAVSLDITYRGQTVTVGAQRSVQYTSSAITNSLCRTWNLGKVKLVLSYNGETVNQTYNSAEEFERDMYGDDPDGGYAKQVIFTKSGTYVVFYSDNSLAVSTWKWTNESAGQARYSWNYDNINDPYESGAFDISFSGNQLLLTEYIDENVFDVPGYGTVEGSITYYLSEDK